MRVRDLERRQTGEVVEICDAHISVKYRSVRSGDLNGVVLYTIDAFERDCEVVSFKVESSRGKLVLT